MNKYTTKCTFLKTHYGCRVLVDGHVVLEGRAESRLQIGSVFRDLLRTLDKLGGDAFTNASRRRKFKEGNLCAQVKHIWHRN